MTNARPDCPACRVAMQEGHVPDVGNNGRLLRTKWIEGHPEKSLLKGLATGGRLSLDTVTFRCPKCGWLIWFAPEPKETEE